MSQATTATSVGQSGATGRSQASLRDHLNDRVAPYLKKALIEGLNQDVDYPLQWLGEHLIHLSMLHEGNSDSTDIRAHFKYNHEAPPAPENTTTTTVRSEEQPEEATVITNGSAHLNGVEHAVPDTALAEGPNIVEDAGGMSQGTSQDAEMQDGI